MLPPSNWAESPRSAFRPTPDFTDDELDDALSEANIPILLASAALMTSDDRWVSPPFVPTPPPDLGDHDDGGFDEVTRKRIREEIAAVLRGWRDGTHPLPAEPPDPTRVARILGTTLAEDVPEEYGVLIGEEMGLYARHSIPEAPVGSDFRVVIIGAGISGLAMAVRLAQAGIDYVILEKNHDVGGTWHENVYPGCAVDTPSFLYALSFDPNPDWSRYFAPQKELASYWRSMAERLGVKRHIRFGVEAKTAIYDERTATWTVTTTGPGSTEESVEANVLVTAVGLLNTPSVPTIAGLEDFDGPVHHTARWDSGLDLTGKRLAVIGTGASAMQLVPASAGTAAKVTVFQRTAQWAMPHPLQKAEVSAAKRFLNRHVPFYLAWYRARLFWRMGDKVWGLLQVDPDYPHLGRAVNKGNDRLRAFLTAHIERELEGRPDLLAKSLPDYPPYGKRLLIDNGWFKTLRRDDVELVTEGIEAVTSRGVRTTDGVEHEVDVIAVATGFKATDVLASVEIRGRDGKTLKETWGKDDGRAHLGITVPGFPNLFCIYGPNTNTGHGGTVIAGTEMQVQHISALIAAILDRRLASIEVKQEAYDAYNAELDDALSRTVWHFGGTSTYYRNDAGRIVTNSPWKYVDYWRRVHEPRLDEFRLALHGPAADEPTLETVNGELR